MSSDATTTPNAGADDLILSSLSSSGKVALLKLNRPKALNALSSPLMQRLNEELARIDRDDSIGAVVLTGAGERAFAGEGIPHLVLCYLKVIYDCFSG